jgi:type I restriction enzyme S subunit
MANLNTGILSKVPLRVPNKTEQQKIAAVLSALDAKIDLNQRINAELEALAKTVYDYWFVQFDFPDAHGRPYKSSGGAMVWNDALKREIPAGWEAGTLADAIQLEYGKPLKEENRSGTGFPVVGSNGIVGYHGEFLIEGPGIVVGRKGTVGAITFSHENFYPIDTTYYVKPRRTYAFNFLLQLLRSLPLTRLNSDSAVPGLNRDSALRLPIVLPPGSLVEKFDTLAATLAHKTKAALTETRELSALRDWLLPLLMNGQVKVG